MPGIRNHSIAERTAGTKRLRLDDELRYFGKVVTPRMALLEHAT